jgi:hypothetical protein
VSKRRLSKRLPPNSGKCLTLSRGAAALGGRGGPKVPLQGGVECPVRGFPHLWFELPVCFPHRGQLLLHIRRRLLASATATQPACLLRSVPVADYLTFLLDVHRERESHLDPFVGVRELAAVSRLLLTSR